LRLSQSDGLLKKKLRTNCSFLKVRVQDKTAEKESAIGLPDLKGRTPSQTCGLYTTNPYLFVPIPVLVHNKNLKIAEICVENKLANK